METKVFPTNEVISTITGRLVCDIGGIYRLLNWMTGEDVFTHQLPRVGKEACPVVLKMHPLLAQAVEEAEQVTPENWQHWRDIWFDRYGPELAVPKMAADDHERIDPMSELSEMVHPEKIIPVVLPPSKARVR